MEKELFDKLIILLIITLSCANLVFSIYNFYTIRESTKATKEKIDDLEGFKKYTKNEFQIYSSKLDSIIQEKMDELEVLKKNITNELKFYSSKILKINSGTFEFGWETSSNYYLHKSIYAKTTYTISIYFPENYSNIPKVYVTLIKFDLSNTENTRVGLNVYGVTTTRFYVEIYTWAKSRVFTGEVSWFSYGY